MNVVKERLAALLPEKVQKIIEALIARGGTPYIVGGAVRDAVLGYPTKDIDIEVHSLPLDELQSVLKKFGHVDLVGKAYGVLKLHGIEADWSVPRTDAEGRKPSVSINTSMALKDACERRDLTMNAMAYNLKTNEIEDPFYGLKDIEAKRLRAPNPRKFKEDPLRFWRVMQFIGRFLMKPDEELNKLCATIDLSTVSKERISDELKKLFLKSPKPSIAFRWLDEIGRLEKLFPELYALKEVQQRPDYHPEGDVFEHTMQAIDAAASLEYHDDEERVVILLATLCHDLGKQTRTQIQEDGLITSHGHAQESARLAKQMLKRFFNDKSIIEAVSLLAYHHMDPGHFVSQGAKPAAYKRLANKLAPLSLKQLSYLFYADRMGRNEKRGEPLKIEDEEVNLFKEKAGLAKVYHEPEPPILLGRDLMPDVPPGPHMGRLLRKAYELQINEGIADAEELKKRVLKQSD